MDGTVAETLRRRSGLSPLVRATHSEFEVEYLPPYGDPEVDVAGEVVTYAIVGAIAAVFVDHLDR